MRRPARTIKNQIKLSNSFWFRNFTNRGADAAPIIAGINIQALTPIDSRVIIFKSIIRGTLKIFTIKKIWDLNNF